MKIINTVDEFLTETKLREGVNVIYGAGWAGSMLCEFMKSEGMPVAAFAVTKKREEQTVGLADVYSLDEILGGKQQRPNINIILAIGELYRAEMERELEERKISSYYEISEAMQCEIYMRMIETRAENAEAIEKIPLQMTVGYLSRDYPHSWYTQERMILNKIDGVSYTAIPWETSKIVYEGTRYEKDISAYRDIMNVCYCPDKYIPDVDIIHTINDVCNINKPWCSSFETTIPRMWPVTEEDVEYYLQFVDYMKRPSCKALYAFCQNAYEIQRHTLMSYISSDDVELLMKKTKVLHPPQEVLITKEEFEKKHAGQEIHFIFVGKDFFTKGGREMVQALSKFEDKYKFKLTLISSLGYKDTFTGTSYEEMLRCKAIIEEKNWIDYYPYLPNKEVLEKCKEATVGLLPSVAETYGFAVLEMQAAGCPVVTTNIRAFPEINNEECGWMCRLPLNALGYCIQCSSMNWSLVLEKELERCFQDIFEYPESIREKGEKALVRIEKMHNPYEYQNELRKCLAEGN